MNAAPILYEEWLAEVERVTIAHPDAFTTRELMTSVGKTERWCVEHIRRGIELGALRPTRKQITDMAGRPLTVPAYERIQREVTPCPTSSRTSKKRARTGGCVSPSKGQ